MGGCLSKKKKKKQEDDDMNKEEGRGKDRAGSTTSRDPPPTEEEEEVKEVLSETPNFVTALNLNTNRQNSRRRPLIPTIDDQQNLLPLTSSTTTSTNNKIKDHISEIDRSSSSSNKKKKRAADLDDDDVCREVVTSSEGFSASSTANLTDSSTTLTVNNVEFEGEEEGEGESTKMTRMKKMRSGITRSNSTSPAKPRRKKMINDRPDINSNSKVVAGGKMREMRVGHVDIGCRSGRSSPSPSKARENGSSRGRSTTSSSFSGNYYYSNNYKRSDVVVGGGERSGRRWVSPADDGGAAATATANANANAMKRDGRTTNGGRSFPQAQAQAPPRLMRRIPPASAAGSSSSGGGKVGQQLDGKYCVDHGDAAAPVDAGTGDGNLRSPAKETSLDNPLVSMECFIFL